MSTPQPPHGSSDEPRDPRDETGHGGTTPPPSAPEPPQPVYGAPAQGYGAPQAPNAQQPYGGPQQQPYGGPQQQPYGIQQQPYNSQQQPYGAAPAYGQAPQPTEAGNGLAIASIVVGGVGLVLSFVGFGVVLAIVGLVLGIVALVKKKGKRLLALIGTVVSGVGVLVGIAAVIVGLVIGAATVQAINESMPTSGAIDPSESSSEAAAENNDFGDTFAYTDGLAVTVSAPEPYTPGEYSSGADQAANVVFTVTVKNDTDANFEPMPYETATSGGVEASKVYDSDIERSPSTVVPAGQSITYRVVFSVADPEQIVFQMAPSFDYDDVVFAR